MSCPGLISDEDSERQRRVKKHTAGLVHAGAAPQTRPNSPGQVNFVPTAEDPSSGRRPRVPHCACAESLTARRESDPLTKRGYTAASPVCAGAYRLQLLLLAQAPILVAFGSSKQRGPLETTCASGSHLDSGSHDPAQPRGSVSATLALGMPAARLPTPVHHAQ